ncbi:MAG: hypothetical protein KA319_07215 [Ferruginibacter sp.]|nr:hypothetical protein [Ferruginibacter sp.]
MRPLLIIALLLTIKSYGQTYDKFINFTSTQIELHKNELTNYEKYFALLFKKRDTSYLREKISNSKADKIYIIEGYNFKTDKYSIFEEYKNSDTSFQYWGNSEFYLDKEKQKYGGYYFLFDTLKLFNDNSKIDTIFPRKYRYGAGCVISDKTNRIFKRLRKKAKSDGLVIETYCRVETLIDKRTSKILVKYCFPIRGQRECDLRAGMFSDYPESFDFWLFTSPYYADN